VGNERPSTKRERGPLAPLGFIDILERKSRGIRPLGTELDDQVAGRGKCSRKKSPNTWGSARKEGALPLPHFGRLQEKSVPGFGGKKISQMWKSS